MWVVQKLLRTWTTHQEKGMVRSKDLAQPFGGSLPDLKGFHCSFAIHHHHPPTIGSLHWGRARWRSLAPCVWPRLHQSIHQLLPHGRCLDLQLLQSLRVEVRLGRRSCTVLDQRFEGRVALKLRGPVIWHLLGEAATNAQRKKKKLYIYITQKQRKNWVVFFVG